MTFAMVPARSLSVAFASLVALSVVAGCLGGPAASPRFEATGSGGVYFLGWDYEAATRQPASAALTIELDESTNTGFISVDAQVDDENVSINLQNFTERSDFHSGGIAANFVEHGDSGVGNALLPRMNLLIATWGPGTISTLDGDNRTDWIDYYTGETEWDAHLMVTDTGVRDEATGRVQTGDGSGPFSPAAPGDAQIEDGDLEAHLVFTSRYANESLAPFNETIEGSIDTPRGVTNHPIAIPIYRAQIVIHIEMGADTGEAGPYSYRIIAPDGTTPITSAVTINPVSGVTSGTLSANVTQPGEYYLRANSGVLPGTYTATIDVVFPEKPVHYFFWEQVTVSERVVP